MPDVLLTGATGYVGGRLLPALLAHGASVRCFARRPEALESRPGVEVVGGDIHDPEAVRRALEGVRVAYYLVHGMGASEDFEESDRRAAETFGAAACEAGVQRIVYLGGLGTGNDLSKHLASRQEVGRVLASSGVETIEFRASIVIGSGSVSFDIIRALTERLPVMITPRWVETRAQPIAIDDVVAYLVATLDLEPGDSTVFEIGGEDVATYGDLMREYARQRGLHRYLIAIPLLTPRLSSLWLALVTPQHFRVGRKLVAGLSNETVVHDPKALERFAVRPRGYRTALEQVVGTELGQRRRTDIRTAELPVAPAQAFAPIRRIGGKTGWYYGRSLWRLRGALDLLAGGDGLRPGRVESDSLTVGARVDFWRVEAYEPDRLLRLRAEMRLPGKAWLEFAVDGDESGSRIRQTAIFDPSGIAGLLYWYALTPFHDFVFRGMLAGIAAEATGAATETFEHAHVVSTPLDEAFAFFSDPANLPRLTPRLMRFQIVERPDELKVGARFRYRVGLVTWIAEITAWDPPHGFADTQVSGPYRMWRHRHELAEVEGGTEVRDVIEYRLRGGPAARVLEPAHRAFLRRLFAYRSRRLDELLG